MNRDIGDGPFGPTRTGAGVEAPGRVELPTNGLGNRCSIHLSYGAARAFYCTGSGAYGARDYKPL